MTKNIWTESEIMEKSRSGEREVPQGNMKYSILNLGEHCTLSCSHIAGANGFPLHLHQHHDEIIIILEGEGEVVVGDERRVIQEGGLYFVPKGTPHTARMNCRVLSVYSPAFDMNNPDRVFLE